MMEGAVESAQNLSHVNTVQDCSRLENSSNQVSGDISTYSSNNSIQNDSLNTVSIIENSSNGDNEENSDPVTLRRSQRQKNIRLLDETEDIEEVEDIEDEDEEENNHEDLVTEFESEVEFSNEHGNKKRRKTTRKNKVLDNSSEKRQVSQPTNCRKCNIKFADAEAYRVHFKQIHSKLKRAADDDVPDDFVKEMLQKKMERKMIKQSQSNAVGIRDYCRKCGKEFEDDNLVVIHLRIDHFESEYGKDIFRNTWKKRTTRHVKRDSDQNKHLFQFVCDDCSHRFKTVETLSYHRKTKHDLETIVDGKVIPPDNEMVCDECGKLCQSRNALANHKSNVHRKLKPYPCDFCEMSFVTKPLLLLHRRSKHLKEQAKIITCEECGLTFTNMKFLTKHKRTHTDFRFKCQHCPRSFRSVSALQGHTDKNHLKVMRHECKFCGRKFWNTANKAKHVKQKHSDGVVHQDLIAINRDKDWTVAGSKVDKVSVEEGLRPDEMPANAVVVDRNKKKIESRNSPLETNINSNSDTSTSTNTNNCNDRRKRHSDQSLSLIQTNPINQTSDSMPYQLSSQNIEADNFPTSDSVIHQSPNLIHSYQLALSLPQGFSNANYATEIVNNSSSNNQRQRMQPQEHSTVHVISEASISIHSSPVSGVCNFCDAYFSDLKNHGLTGHMIPVDKIWSVYLSKSCTLDASVIQSPVMQIQ